MCTKYDTRNASNGKHTSIYLHCHCHTSPSLRFYSIFASPFYYCYNILDGFYPPFFFRLDYVSFFYCTLSDIFLPISVSPLSTFRYSAFLLLTRTTCLFSSSNHITSSYLCYFQNIFPHPNVHISHLDH